jgi:hypothetical protein
MKRAQGLPINTIILAVLGLVVLIILILLVRTQLQKGSGKYSELTSTAEQQAKEKNVCGAMFAYPPTSCVKSGECKGVPRNDLTGCDTSKGEVCCER